MSEAPAPYPPLRQKSHESCYVLYDYMQVSGGAERVTLLIGQHFPHLQLVVSRVYPEARALMQTIGITVMPLGNAWSKRLTRILEAIWCFRYRAQFLRYAPMVLYSGFYAPLAVRHQKFGLKVYYCHTIPRFAYDQYASTKAALPWPLRGAYALAMYIYRWHYERAVKQMDVLLVNSDNVRRRMLKYLHLEATVVHPPVETSKFNCLGDKGYYLSTARLTANKRVDVVVKAFLDMPDKRLVVLSGGPELPRLQELAGSATNIEFVGWQSEQQLREWIGYAHAVIYLPIDEDFGMSPVEAMAAGKPVIGVAEGGLLETIMGGATGILLESPPSPEKLIDAVIALEAMGPDTMRPTCENQATQFDEQAFYEQIREATAGHLRHSRKGSTR